MGTDMIAPTDSGLFETIYNRKDANERPLFAAKIDGATYRINAATFRGTEILRSNAYLMAQQEFCKQLSRLDCCNAERIEYEIKIGEIFDGTVSDIQQVFEKRRIDLEKYMNDYIVKLEKKVYDVHGGTQRTQGTKNLKEALKELERLRKPMLEDQERHRAAYFDRLFIQCQDKTNKKIEPKEAKEETAWAYGPSKRTDARTADPPKDIIRPPRIVEKEKRVEVRVEVQPPPVFVAPSTAIEIVGVPKPSKPKSLPLFTSVHSL